MNAALFAAFLASACATSTKAPPRPEVLVLRSGERSVQVLADDETFARVVLSPAGPAVIEELRGHGGRQILRGFPLHPRTGESVDHPEHLSMWTAHGSVSGFNLWNDAIGPRLTGHALRMRPGGRALIEMTLDWRAPDGSTLCNEARTYTFQSNDQVRTIDVEHELTATGNGVTFGDVREGFFALRLQDGLRIDRGRASVLTSLNIEGHDPYGLPARWIAYSAPLADEDGALEEVTVCVFDSPTNPGYPTRWFARPYGLVAANPFARTAFEEPDSLTNLTPPEGFRLKAYESASFLYRVIVARGTLDAEEIEALWTAFAGETAP
ncbi:hypothetical protein Poly30_10510 [Planctomycetes bacterium Poly30]|uniref:Methane oxygenase PmoA n=2 Tax=Saltatorellus ferox TaxID=2528018 RepID=A0A518EN88_9BACT|nr:hypothetical protein Poly30_10510 [Planctomycetes bacterium Poly30]